ncbi:MAG TPA: hypothetical protein VGN63_19565 [Flavisolibacter sp.]|jgi:hypothetical protein|nr:hypothetical protein [Flavisolibacter sp.]
MEAYATLGLMIFNKAHELNVNPTHLQRTIIYLAKMEKDTPSEDDEEIILQEVFKTYFLTYKEKLPDADDDLLRLKVLGELKLEQLKFQRAYQGVNWFDFVKQNCQHEIQAMKDFILMSQTHFSPEDMENVINSYKKY